MNRELTLTRRDSVYALLGELFPRSEPLGSPDDRADGEKEIRPSQCCGIEESMV